MKVLIFGNILVKGDNLALKLMPELRKEFSDIEFKDFDPTEDLQNEGRRLLIIDAVIGLLRVKELVLENDEDFERVELNSGIGMHDFDLGYNLRLLRNLDLIDGVRIVCVPMVIEDEEKAFGEICKVLKGWLD